MFLRHFAIKFPKPKGYVPQCNPNDWDFTPMQCNDHSGKCWCVERIYGQITTAKVNGTKIAELPCYGNDNVFIRLFSKYETFMKCLNYAQKMKFSMKNFFSKYD